MATPSGSIKYSQIKALNSTALTSVSISKLRNFNLKTPQSGMIKFSNLRNQYPFPTINAPSSSLAICYSIRKVIPTYTGPVFQLRRSSDNALQTFYTDDVQSYLTTGANNTGTTYSSWIGANTAYVTIWYDQSTNANNASNAVNGTTQPNISLQSGKYVIQFQNANSTVLNITTSYSPNTVFCHFYNTNASYGTIITTAFDFGQRFGSTNGSAINGDNNGGDWFYSGTGTKIAYNNGVASTTILLNAWNCLCLSIGTASGTPFNRIGMDGYSNTRAINGYMTEIMLHNKAVVANDMISYYNNRLF